MAKRSGSERPAPPVIVETKLHVPTPRRRLVHRPTLLALLDESPAPTLTVVVAPPGWGKSTLLAQWCAWIGPARVAWMSVDRADHDPVRFWTHVIEALRTVDAELGRTAREVLRTPGAGVIDVVLPSLLNDLAGAGSETVLILDDYLLAGSAEIHDHVAFLVTHAPATFRVVIAARADPPLPLARFRAEHELREVRLDELRFTASETDELLTHVLELELAPDDVARLHERTEGWAAGLSLAALSLREHGDPHGFVSSFAGDDRNVVDYLAEEVIEGQPPDVRRFLLRTSVLDRLHASLCDAVTGGSDGRAMLERLERENLFLIPLDTRRRWYRYHHLFGELLARELEATEPDAIPDLHRRAAAWFREHGGVADAVQHAIAGRDVEGAAEMITASWNEEVNSGRWETVHQWLRSLPEARVRADARLCLARAGTSLTMGRRDEVDEWLDAALAHPDAPPTGDDGTSVAAEASIYRALHRTMRGDVGPAVASARRAVELERDDASPWGAMAFASLGRPLYWRGEPADAAAAFREAVARADPPRNNLAVIASLGYLATIEAEAGHIRDAERTASRALDAADDAGLSEHWVTLMALVGRAVAAEADGRLADAAAAAARAVELGRRGVGAIELARALIAPASIHRAIGEPRAARTYLDDAARTIEGCPDPGVLPDRIGELRSRGGQTTIPQRGEALTDRELEVLRLLPTSKSLREIGADLFVSLNTVKTHTRGIYRKLDVGSRDEAVPRARELGLL
jgi:LuxR family transcriptional regulator, maltose regulon positive regulatory protein